MKPQIIFITLSLIFGLNACKFVTENSTPSDFLKVDGTFNENFWGDKINIRGTISNSAESITFKDVEVKITFLTKTNTELHSESFIIYDYFPPQSQIKFDHKIDNYMNVEKYRVVVVDAVKL